LCSSITTSVPAGTTLTTPESVDAPVLRFTPSVVRNVAPVAAALIANGILNNRLNIIVKYIILVSVRFIVSSLKLPFLKKLQIDMRRKAILAHVFYNVNPKLSLI
jgi:hypothetical protein